MIFFQVHFSLFGKEGRHRWILQLEGGVDGDDFYVEICCHCGLNVKCLTNLLQITNAFIYLTNDL